MAQGIAYSEYSILLGAGASVGAIGGNGRTLPTGAGLRDALVTEFNLDSGEDTLTLAEAYGYLQRHRAHEVNAYLRDWFTNCRPTWQGLLAEFNWRRVWTLNIDDVAENAFRETGRPTESLTWNQRFSDRAFATGHQIIHLHGYATHLDDSAEANDALVFSLNDYVREVSNPRTWHKVFWDEFAGNPFIVIGARLTEEIDLVDALSRGNTSAKAAGLPSVIVVPDIAPIRREQLETAGFMVVEMEGEAFVDKLRGHYREVISTLSDVYGPASTPGSRKFLQQFIDLRTYAPVLTDLGNFYSGYQPTWGNIQSDDDAVLDKSVEAASAITELAQHDTIYQTIVLLTGNPGSGKSTALLRIAANLRSAGMFPFLFRGDEYLDKDAAIEWLKSVPRSVLLFDDFSDHSRALQELAETCEAEKVRFLAIGADRPGKHRIIGDRINPQYLDFKASYWYGRVSDDDVDRLISKLHSRGRLGKITRLDSESQREHFIGSAGRSLFDAMAELEGGAGFKETVAGIYNSLPSDSLKDLYAAACMCYEVAMPMPTGIGASIAGVTPKELMTLIERECRGFLVITRAGIRPPHRITATMAVNALPRVVKAKISLSLAQALAPHIDERSMREGTREYRIARDLMNHEIVIRTCGQEEGRSWYERLRPYYDWNGRYWDQRALFESRFERHETARSYAERSVQVHPHPFGYNTLGTVLLRMAIKQGSVNSLDEGVKNLRLSKAFRAWGRREHPFTGFFTSLVRYAESWGIDQVPQPLRDAWGEWFVEAQTSQVFSDRQGYEQLLEWQRQWLKLSLAS